MNQVAVCIGGIVIYWSAIVIFLAVAVCFNFAYGLYVANGGKKSAMWTMLPISIVLGAVFSRIIHWYCHAEQYSGLIGALTDFGAGDYCLPGAFFGVVIAVLIVKALRLTDSAAKMFDAIAPAATLGVAVLRMSALFNVSCRGKIQIHDPKLQMLPLASPVATANGAVEYRLATFLIQAMIAGILFLARSIFYIIGHDRKLKDGDTTLIFLLCYCGTQILLDSTRYDSIYFRSNGFVSVVQVLSAVALGFVIVWFSIRMVRSKGFKLWYVGLWCSIALRIGGAGYMEYYVQRHSNLSGMAYTIMGICLTSTILLTLVIRAIAVQGEKAAEKGIEEGYGEIVTE